MKWQHVASNWPAFYETIIDRWPNVDEESLDEIDGDQRGFLSYIAEIEGLEPEEAQEEVREWLASEIPADVIMDEIHSNISIRSSSKYISNGDDEYDNNDQFDDGESD